MIKFAKTFLLFSISFVLIATFTIGYSHYSESECLKTKKKVEMDAYYFEEMKMAWFNLCSTKDSTVCRGEVRLEDAKSNAIEDGYSRCEVELMSDRAFDDGQELRREWDQGQEERKSKN